MTDYCEIVEDTAVATSECPTVEGVLVGVSSGAGASVAMPVIDHPVLEETASCTSQVTIEAYAVLTSAALADSSMSPTLVVTGHLASVGEASSSATAFISELASASADARSEISADAPALLISAAQAVSSVTANSTAVFYANEGAKAASSVTLGLSEAVESAASAGAMVVLLRRVEQLVVESATGEAKVFPSAMPQDFLLLSTGAAASVVLMQTEHHTFAEASVEAAANVWYKDPARVAWVMNTETAAASWYDNFDFESLAQTPDKVLGVGPDGLYEMVGGTDSGERIDAEVVSDFTDFGLPQTKRVDYMYFGYTSPGRISVTAETYGSGHPPVTYFLEQRLAAAPRNSRVEPGKGLFGRYWRMTIRNVAGAEFEIHDATVDIAVSNRKV